MSEVLEEASESISVLPSEAVKVVVHIRAGPNTPILKQTKFKVNAADNFDFISDFLRKQLRLSGAQPLV